MSGLALEEVNYYEQTYKADDKKDNTSFAIRDRYRNTYSNRNDVKLHAVEGERVESRGDVSHDYKVPVNTRTIEDVNGEVTDIESNQPSESRHALINSEHCVVFKNTSKGRNYYFYAEKQPGKIVLMAYFGDFPETLRYQIKHGLQRDAYVPPVVNVDVNHHAPSASYPPAVPSHYTVPQAMTYQQIAEELNYTGYADAIAHANGRMADDVVPAHATIRIPTLYFAIPETAWNGTALTVDQLMSLVYPTLPMPGVKFKKHHLNYWALGLEAVAAAAIMALVPGALEALGPMLAYTMAAAMASASTQVIAMGFGTQSGFEVKDFARDTALAAISGGLAPQLGTAEKISASIMLRNMLIAETIAMAQQAALVGSGVQKQVNYAVLGATALKSVVSTASSSVRNPIVNAMINDIADRVIDTAVLNQHVSPPVLAVQTAGSLVGSYLGTRTLDKLQGDRKLAAEVEMHTAKTMPTQRTRMQHKSVPQKVENQRAVHLSATEDEVQQTGLDIDDVTFNVPEPVLPLGDTIHADPATYALSEMNSQRMQAARTSRLSRWKTNEDKYASLIRKLPHDSMMSGMFHQNNESVSDVFWEDVGRINGFVETCISPVVNAQETINGLENLAYHLGVTALNLDTYGSSRNYLYKVKENFENTFQNLREQSKNSDPYTRGYAKGSLFSFFNPGTEGFGGVIGSTRLVKPGIVKTAVGGEGVAKSANVLQDVLKTAIQTPGKPNQLEAIIDDGSKVIFRRDIGEYAHEIKRGTGVKVDHFNIEIQVAGAKAGRFNSIENLHVVVDKNLNFVEAFTSKNGVLKDVPKLFNKSQP